MFLHFLYVEHKELKETYITIIKFDKEILETVYVNKLLYKNLYLSEISDNNVIDNNLNVNFYSLFYIKKGFVIENNNILWNKILKIYMKNINLIYLIDNNYLNKLKDSNILLFNIELYKNDLYDIIINIQL